MLRGILTQPRTYLLIYLTLISALFAADYTLSQPYFSFALSTALVTTVMLAA